MSSDPAPDGLVSVRFEPGGECVEVPRGTSVLEAAYLAGVHILATCGGRGTCGKCGVRIIEGTPGPPLPAIRPVRMPPGIQLACLMTVDGPVTVKPMNVIRPPRK